MCFTSSWKQLQEKDNHIEYKKIKGITLCHSGLMLIRKLFKRHWENWKIINSITYMPLEKKTVKLVTCGDI